MTYYAVLYLRPDGWWEAGRGWTEKGQAEADAREQLPDGKNFKVVAVRKRATKHPIQARIYASERGASA